MWDEVKCLKSGEQGSGLDSRTQSNGCCLENHREFKTEMLGMGT